MTDRKDLVIIGSGPAGLSAAVYAQRAMLDQVVIEKEPFSGGQIITTERIDNYLGLYGMGGYELAMKFREHADALSVPFLEGEVTAINDDGEVKQITLASGETIETKAVLFATGARHKTLSVKGEKELAGVISTQYPYVEYQPALITVPAAAALTGVPTDTYQSTPE